MFWSEDRDATGFMTYGGAPGSYSRGPVSGLGEIFGAADEQVRLVDNFNAREAARDDEINQRNDAIFKATGVRLENPFDHYTMHAMTHMMDNPHKEYDRRRQELAAAHPELRDVIKPDLPVLKMAGHEQARQAEERMKDLMGRSDSGWLPWGAQVAGGMFGMMRDSTNVAAMLVGGGEANMGRSILWSSARAAALNMGTEAALQPMVQSWRAEAGLKSGFGEGVKNVGMAGLFGFGMEASGRTIAKGFSVLLGSGGKPVSTPAAAAKNAPMEQLDAAARNLPPDHPVRKAAEGDDDALLVVARETMPHADPAEMDAIRGAVASVQAERDIMRAKPEGVLDADHTDAMIKTVRHALYPDHHPAPARSPEVIRKAREKPLTNDGPAPAKKGESFSYYDRPVAYQGFDASSLEFDAKAFQFKGDGDTSGVSAKLQGVEKWNPLAANKIFVFERADGAHVIADGHQRLGLARRLLDQGKEEKINLDGYLFRERDGWSPSDVRVIAAKKNLQEGTGNVMDAARIIREAPEVIDDSVPVSSHQMRQARQLARLSDDAFGLVLNDVVKPNYGALVAQFVGDESRHGSVMRELAELQPGNEMQARQMIADINALPTTIEVQNTLFGELTETRSLFRERAKIMDHGARQLKREKTVFGVLVNEADRLERAGNAVNRAGNEAIVDQAGQVAELITRLAAGHGPVSDILNRQAARLADGATLKSASQGFVDELRELFDKGGVSALTAPPPKPRLLADPGDGDVGKGLGSGLGRGLGDMMQEQQTQRAQRGVEFDEVFTRREDAGPDEVSSGFDEASRIDDLAGRIEGCS